MCPLLSSNCHDLVTLGSNPGLVTLTLSQFESPRQLIGIWTNMSIYQYIHCSHHLDLNTSKTRQLRHDIDDRNAGSHLFNYFYLALTWLHYRGLSVSFSQNMTLWKVHFMESSQDEPTFQGLSFKTNGSLPHRGHFKKLSVYLGQEWCNYI